MIMITEWCDNYFLYELLVKEMIKKTTITLS